MEVLLGFKVINSSLLLYADNPMFYSKFTFMFRDSFSYNSTKPPKNLTHSCLFSPDSEPDIEVPDDELEINRNLSSKFENDVFAGPGKVHSLGRKCLLG